MDVSRTVDSLEYWARDVQLCAGHHQGIAVDVSSVSEGALLDFPRISLSVSRLRRRTPDSAETPRSRLRLGCRMRSKTARDMA